MHPTVHRAALPERETIMAIKARTLKGTWRDMSRAMARHCPDLLTTSLMMWAVIIWAVVSIIRLF